MIVLVVLVIGEGTVIFLASSNEMDELLENNWAKLNASIRAEIAEELSCDVDDPSECIAAARSEAESSRRLIYYISGSVIVYQLIMLICSGFYLKGLGIKLTRIDRVKLGPDRNIGGKHVSPLSDAVEQLNSGEIKYIK